MEASNYTYEKVKRPTDEQFKQITDKYGFHLTEQEKKDYQRYIDANLEAYDKLALMPDYLPVVKYPRTPGYFPDPSENKLNAWYVKTEVKGAPSGKLAGRKVVLKDNVCLAGVPMMYGSPIIEGYIPEIDATIVTRLLDAGATIVGKANCENLCFSGGSFTCAKGPVHNPHKLGFDSGGSSSGTAALVGSGEVELGIGGDQGGSIRIPACWSGCVGLKPTYGLVPYTGILPVELSLDHTGPITANVLDNALMLEVLAGPDDLDPRQYLPEGVYGDYTSKIKEGAKGLKIGILKEGFGHKQSESVVDAYVTKAALKFKELGATVEEVSIPEHLVGPIAVAAITCEGGVQNMFHGNSFGTGYRGLYLPSAMKAHARWRTMPDELPVMAKMDVILADYLSNQYHGTFYAKGQNLSRKIKKAYDDKFKEYDIIIMPTVPFRPLPLPEKDCDFDTYMARASNKDVNVAVFNVTGHPSLTIPIAKVDGLPIGMMLVSKYFNEAAIYQAAYAWENAYDWRKEN